MDSLTKRPDGALAFDPKQYGLKPNPTIYTCDGGQWRKYDGPSLEHPALPFTRYESIAIVDAKNGGQYLHVEVSSGCNRFAIRQRCDGNRGQLQLTAHSLTQGMLGQFRLNGTLIDVAGYFEACKGNKPGPSGFTGNFINVIDLTSGNPLRVPTVLLDRQLDTGDFASAVQMLQQSLSSFA